MKCFGTTDVGKKREINEDFFLMDENKGIFIVADGLGGYQAGEVASAMASKKIHASLNNQSFNDIDNIYSEVNKDLLAYASKHEECKGMATTVVLAKIEKPKLLFSNIGDSRLYGVKENAIRQLSVDHSLVEELKERGIKLTESEMSQKRNIITSALGTDEDFKYNVDAVDLDAYESYLLCSDGLTNMVTDQEILEIIKLEKSLEEKCRLLIKKANEQGGNDNITVIVLEI